MQMIVNQSGLPKHRATECLNALVHSKDVIKVNKKVGDEAYDGLIWEFNEEKTHSLYDRDNYVYTSWTRYGSHPPWCRYLLNLKNP